MPTYSIRSGDSLSSIAQRYHTSVGALARANHISNPSRIAAGRTLNIPGSRDTFEPAARTTSRSTVARTSNAAAPTGGTATGRRLASAAQRAALGMGGYRSLGRCATGVSRALRSGLGLSVSGNGNQIDNNLPRGQFRQVNMSLEQALRTPGMVLTWEHTSTRLGRRYGHTAITLGDGHSSASDFIERNTTNHGRTGLKVFAPIS